MEILLLGIFWTIYSSFKLTKEILVFSVLWNLSGVKRKWLEPQETPEIFQTSPSALEWNFSPSSGEKLLIAIFHIVIGIYLLTD